MATFSSRFNIGELVISPEHPEYGVCEILSVRFTRSKVFYDLLTDRTNGGNNKLINNYPSIDLQPLIEEDKDDKIL